ncbi:MAG TPA: hypothetical protein DEH22_16190 [Chloroflexi bacterium]|nr:hypothetical protein [Chloroflexota bacterium]
MFNSLSWPRKALVDTADGLLEVKVPACGWATIPHETLATGDSQAAARASLWEDGFMLENELICARFDQQGQLVSLWDKETAREIMAAPGNRLNLYKDVPTNWDAWDLDSMAEMQPVPTSETAQISINGSSPLVARVSLHRNLHKSTLDQIISLRRGSRRIDFNTTVDWQESHKLLKVSFPVDIHSSEAISEIQFGHLRRPNHRSRQYDQDRFEVSNHKWTALAEEGRGAAVLNDCKYGLSVTGKSINLTLLKSALAPDMTADKGIQQFTYALYSWNGSLLESGLVREAYDLNVPALIVAGLGEQPSQSIFSVDAPNVIIETVKPAEDGSRDLIVRLYEALRTATRCTLTTSLPIVAALQTNLLEENLSSLDFADGKIVLDFRPFEIKTVRLRI